MGESDETTGGPVDECPPPDPELLALSFSVALESTRDKSGSFDGFSISTTVPSRDRIW